MKPTLTPFSAGFTPAANGEVNIVVTSEESTFISLGLSAVKVVSFWFVNPVCEAGNENKSYGVV
jgi:hypothetical protein